MIKSKYLITTFVQVLTFCCLTLGFFAPPLWAGEKMVSLRENAIVKAVRRVRPAVVNIRSESAARYKQNPFANRLMDPFFDSFFRDFFERQPQRPRTERSLGSGVIIDGKKGIILTNAHVVTKAVKISVVLADESEYAAEIIGADPDTDLAVLKIEADQRLPEVRMQTVDDPMIGETVIAIGNPFGFSHSVTTGVVSALNRSIHTDQGDFFDFIQTDASINPGNSGGPLLNIDGDLIGINTAIYSKAQGIGFAIPIAHAQKIIADLITHGEVMQSWIGIRVQELSPRMVAYLDLKTEKGVLVKFVDPDSPAQKARIREGDVIFEINRNTLSSIEAYNRALKQIEAGDALTIRLWRKGKRIKVRAKAAEFPHRRILEISRRLLQIEVRTLYPDSKEDMGEGGVVITSLGRGSYMDRMGIRKGDVIHKIDDFAVTNLEDYKKAIMKSRHKSAIVILLQRGRQLYYVPVRI